MRFGEALIKMGDKAIKSASGGPVYFLDDGVLSYYQNGQATRSNMMAEVNRQGWEVVDRPIPCEIVPFSVAMEYLAQGKTVESYAGQKYKLCTTGIGKQDNASPSVWVSANISAGEVRDQWKVYL